MHFFLLWNIEHTLKKISLSFCPPYESQMVHVVLMPFDFFFFFSLMNILCCVKSKKLPVTSWLSMFTVHLKHTLQAELQYLIKSINDTGKKTGCKQDKNYKRNYKVLKRKQQTLIFTWTKCIGEIKFTW